jgi:hypothetical protein
MDNFDLKRFLVENKMTRNSRLLNEQPEAEGIPADDPLAQIPAVPAETPSEPSGEIDKETAKELIFNTGGKFFTVNFLAQDKDERGKQKVDANGVKLLRPRTMNARLGVKKYLRGGELKFNPDDFNLINVFDMVKKGYRFINADTIQSLKIGNKTYTVTQETTEPTTDEPQLNENKASRIETMIQQEYPQIIEGGEVEQGTEEWLFLIQLALKAYGINIENEYDILAAIDGEGPYAEQIENLDYEHISDLETALENLGVEVF